MESETATDAEVRAVEVAMIRELRSNDPAVGYNPLAAAPAVTRYATSGPLGACPVSHPTRIVTDSTAGGTAAGGSASAQPDGAAEGPRAETLPTGCRRTWRSGPGTAPRA